MLLDCSKTFLQENDGGTESSKTVTGGNVVGSTSVNCGLGGRSGSVGLASSRGHHAAVGRGSGHRLDQCARAVGDSNGGGR